MVMEPAPLDTLTMRGGKCADFSRRGVKDSTTATGPAALVVKAAMEREKLEPVAGGESMVTPALLTMASMLDEVVNKDTH